MKPLNRDPCAPRKLRPSDTSLGYDVHQSRPIPARAPLPPSTPASRTANVISNFLAGGPRSRREVEHAVLSRRCEEGTFEDALALLGAIQLPTMFLPARGLVMMVRLPGQRIEKTAYEAPVEAPRRQRRPFHLGTRKVF
jgi:hypothetical protein